MGIHPSCGSIIWKLPLRNLQEMRLGMEVTCGRFENKLGETTKSHSGHQESSVHLSVMHRFGGSTKLVNLDNQIAMNIFEEWSSNIGLGKGDLRIFVLHVSQQIKVGNDMPCWWI
jgi:hypothetical protein